jgi:SAM-dependent methyltransferase
MDKLQYDIMNSVEKSHWWFRAKRNFIKTLIFNSDLSYISILDLGCGTGETSKFLEKFGKVDRVEISPYAHKYLKIKALSFIKGGIEKVDLKSNSYDIVCLFDVLYHKKVKNIQKIFDRAAKTLKPNGHLVITDSAMPFLFSKHDHKMHAKRRFFLSDFTGLLQNSGFIIEKKSYIYFFLFPVFMVSRILNVFFDFETVGDINSIINFLLYKICIFEAYLLKYFSYPFGSSLIIKARKIS